MFSRLNGIFSGSSSDFRLVFSLVARVSDSRTSSYYCSNASYVRSSNRISDQKVYELLPLQLVWIEGTKTGTKGIA